MKLYGDEMIFDLELKNGDKVEALGFWGSESYLSNFYPTKIEVELHTETKNTVTLSTSEHFFMLLKAYKFNDMETADDIINAPNPSLAKHYGRQVKNYDDNEWDSVRYTMMYFAVKEKFIQNERLKQRLLETGDLHLVEASPYDKIWGVGVNVANNRIKKENLWFGKNLLGKILMEVRDELKKKK